MTNYRTYKMTRPFTRFLYIFIMTSCAFCSCFVRKIDGQSTIQKNKIDSINMNKILIIGMDPKTIDFTNPELPKGLSVEVIEQGTKATLEKLNSLGYDTEIFLIETGATDLSKLVNQLKEKNYDGVVIGNGIRGVRVNFILFEQIINVVHASAPKSKIIFNTLPSDTDEAIKRWL
jgi:hypothetical protein